MRRRLLLLSLPLVPLSLFLSRYLKAGATEPRQPINYREQAETLNKLASNIQTPADARTFVDFVAGIFSENLPSGLSRSTIQERVAQAEFAAVSNSQNLIPEQRLVNAWNTFAKTIAAPHECQITDEELLNLRDAFLATSQVSWERGGRNIWSAPAIYAAGPDGHIAAGCRAIEAIRVLWDIANMPDNLAAARVRVQTGTLASDLFRHALENPATTHGGFVTMRPATPNPAEIAMRKYIAKNGASTFSKALSTLLDDTLLPPQAKGSSSTTSV